ncbi:MAG: ACT domain-containing protein [Atopobiaceae bacterium]
MAGSETQAKDRAIVAILGNDRAGIVAAATVALAKADVNILNISQTIMNGIFTMSMEVDLTQANKSFAEIQEDLDNVARELNLQITIQREDVFNYMHRV